MSGKWLKPTGWQAKVGYEDVRPGCPNEGCSVCPRAGLIWHQDLPRISGLKLVCESDPVDIDLESILNLVEDGVPTPGRPRGRNSRFGERASDYRTQKARGVHAIKREAFPNLAKRRGLVGAFPRALYTLPHDGMDLCKSLFASPYPTQYFARPCPTTPRHGFVESRSVYSQNELENLVARTLKEDPNGEVLVMPALSGLCSAVAHNAGITWGHGNDGVTGTGAGCAVIPVPVPVDNWKKFQGTRWTSDNPGFYDTWDQDFADQVPYVEIVENKGEAIPVQVRAGPAQEVGKNYVPYAFKVKKVLSPKMSAGSARALLEWEAKVAKAVEENKGPEGLVLYHFGLPLASHWAIHAIQANIPVITDGPPPQVGDRIPAQSTVVQPLTPGELEKLAKYIKDAQGFALGKYDPRQVILTAMASAHALSFWSGDNHLLRYRALAVEMIARYVSAACIGEDRHFYTCGPGRPNAGCPSPEDYSNREEYEADLVAWNDATDAPKDSNLPWEQIYGRKVREGIERASVYFRMLAPMAYKERRNLTALARKDFRMSGWGNGEGDRRGDEACSYGGKKWGQVCDAAIALDDAAERFCALPNRTNYDKMVAKMNMACHVAHNGGGVLTKWVKQEALNEIAVVPTWGFMNYFAGVFALNGFKHVRDYSQECE